MRCKVINVNKNKKHRKYSNSPEERTENKLKVTVWITVACSGVENFFDAFTYGTRWVATSFNHLLIIKV